MRAVDPTGGAFHAATMKFLPIIERDLRARSRNRLTWWLRFGVGLAGVLICVPPFFYSHASIPPTTVGRNVFEALVVGAFLLCLGTCVLTAEAVGVERRAGTLGLLLLTRVKILDVLVGKLGSVDMVGFCALLAFLPMLMIPVLAGNVVWSDGCRSIPGHPFHSRAGLGSAFCVSNRIRHGAANDVWAKRDSCRSAHAGVQSRDRIPFFDDADSLRPATPQYQLRNGCRRWAALGDFVTKARGACPNSRSDL